mmetsp:Transcript_26174/g.64871  ORF Transcript_26174/g.64871 Transcript_26174/m.64871 type:complete len:143 (-) Transcript_26174:258-686(-)
MEASASRGEDPTDSERRQGRKRKAPAADAPKTDPPRFQREIRSMMYGFGDSSRPAAESVRLMEEMMLEYVHLLLQQAHSACEERQRATRHRGGADVKLKEQDLLFVLRKDSRRHRRAQEILEVYQEQKELTQERPEYARDDL